MHASLDVFQRKRKRARKMTEKEAEISPMILDPDTSLKELQKEVPEVIRIFRDKGGKNNNSFLTRKTIMRA